MKERVTVKAYAKINLSIDILGRMDNGYHQIESVMQQIDLADDIIIEPRGIAGLYTEYSIKLETETPEFIETKDNLVYKAAVLMAEIFCPIKNNKIKIKLNKRIPMAAGLGGGSSDAAATMLALCKLWNVQVSLEELCQLGVKLGADIPFCILGNARNNPELGFADDAFATSAALAEQIGERLTPVHSLKGWVVLIKPDISVSTEFVYKMLEKYGVLSQMDENIERPDTKELIQALKNKNTDQIIKNMNNVLESVSLKEYPIVVYTKNKMDEVAQPAKVLMSGSGPTVFGFYGNKNDAMVGYENSVNTFLAESGKNYAIYLSKLL